MLAADRGVPAMDASSWWADHTRVTPVDREASGAGDVGEAGEAGDVREAAGPPPSLPPPPPPPPRPAPLPRVGRHAARRRPAWLPTWLPGAADRMPGIGSAQVAVVAIIVAVALAGTTWWLLRARPEPVAPSPAAASAEPLVAPSGPAATSGDTDAAATDGTTVTVDVAGKVRRPGIVVLDAGARVVDALEAAGGARAGVSTTGLNLARVLVDGEQILVGAPAVAPAPGPAPGAGSAPPGAPAQPVNINLADQTQLETLPQVGPVTAAAIIAWREQHGGFASVDQLIEVDGIGEKTLAQIAPFATV
jgi:competence protein ComEA